MIGWVVVGCQVKQLQLRADVMQQPWRLGAVRRRLIERLELSRQIIDVLKALTNFRTASDFWSVSKLRCREVKDPSVKAFVFQSNNQKQ